MCIDSFKQDLTHVEYHLKQYVSSEPRNVGAGASRPGIVSCRDKRLHTRNQHLGNHRGFSVAFSNGLSVVFSNITSNVSCIPQRIVTFPVDFSWNCPMDVQWHFLMESHVSCCAGHCRRPAPPRPLSPGQCGMQQVYPGRGLV